MMTMTSRTVKRAASSTGGAVGRVRRKAGRFIALIVPLALILAACGGAEEADEAPADEAAPAAGEESEEPEGPGEADEPEPDGPSGTLTIATPNSPQTMDPQMHRNRFTQIISHQMREKLAYAKPPGNTDYELLLAESVERINPTTFEIKLREGVRFHNGDPLTAEDVAWTYTRLRDPATESPRAGMGQLERVEEVVAIDDLTVHFIVEEDFSGEFDTFVPGLHLTGQEILHKATYEDLSMDEAFDHPVIGVGPFKFVEWVPDQHIIMEANLDYWQGPPGVEQLIWRTIPEETTRVAELTSGNVDMIYPVSPDFLEQLDDAGMQLLGAEGTAFRIIEFNILDGPFADVEVRRAVNQAIDRELITENIYRGTAVPQKQVTGVGWEGYIEGWDPYPYDPDAASEILTQVDESIEFLTDVQFELAAEAVAEQLRQAGLDVSVVVLDAAGITEANESGDFTMMMWSIGSAGQHFTEAFWDNRFSCRQRDLGIHNTGFCEPELDEMIAEAEAAGARLSPERDAIVQEVVRTVTEEHVPWAPLLIDEDVWATAPHVQGFTPSMIGQFFDMHLVTVDD